MSGQLITAWKILAGANDAKSPQTDLLSEHHRKDATLRESASLVIL